MSEETQKETLEAEDPTAVEGPVSEDETSPEGIPADEEATGVVEEGEGEVPATPSNEAPVVHAPALAQEPPPQLVLIHRPPQATQWRIARIAAAVVLAGAAFVVHMKLNVPNERVIATPKDQGPKPKERGDRGRQERMPERTEAELEEAWSQWGEAPFDDEPMRGRWSRDMQTMVNKAVVVARKSAFAGAPEEPRVIVTGTQCRTIRCQFILRSPYEHEVDLLAKALERVLYEGAPMWRSVVAEAIEPPTPQSPKEDHYRMVTVGVAVDGYEPQAIEIASPEDAQENEAPG